jgi:hypothetical protein
MASQKPEGILNRIYGIISLGLCALAFIIGLAAVAAKSLRAGLIYFLILLAAPFVMVHFFCRKCPCSDKGCGHVFPGMLAKKLGKRDGNYSAIDLAAVAASIGALVIFPQSWLIKRKKLLFLFWTFILAALFQIRFFVCKSCSNRNCPGYQG